MGETKESPAQTVNAPRMALRLRLAAAALAWERLWPALWPATAIIGVFLALALLDLLPQLPGLVHAASLALLVGLLGLAIVTALRRFRLPDRDAGRRRIEQASGLAHRPLTALEDRLTVGSDDAA